MPLFAMPLVATPVAAAASGTAHLVADINPGPATGGTDNYHLPTRFVPLTGRALFAADDGIHGTELWATDGTAAGTYLVADICPGACVSLPREIVRAGDIAYFAADDGAHGVELWRSDGTAAGTWLVAEVEPGLRGSWPYELAAFGQGVGFAARVGDDRGWEPWFSDGTAAGTRSLGDLRPGRASSFPVFWGEIGGELLFTAYEEVHGTELWITDGTAQGTRLLIDLLPGPDSGLAGINHEQVVPLFARLDQRMVFMGRGASGGLVLSVTDGTAGGTVPLRSLPICCTYGLATFADRVFFGTEDAGEVHALWATDGTAAGTVPIATVGEGFWARYPRDLVVAAGKLFFIADDGDHGHELWVSDGTAAGTSMVTDLNAGPGSSAFSYWAGIVPVADGVVFSADDGTHGTEPWFSDGTEAGTVPLGDLFPGPPPSFAPYYPYTIDRRAAIGGRALFRAASPDSGVELWASDGTAAGTELIELNHQTSSMVLASPFVWQFPFDPRPIGVFGDGVLFGADDGVSGEEPWISDGTAGGTVQVIDLYPGPWGSMPSGFVEAAHGGLFAAAAPGDSRPLWSTDGTAGGTVEIAPEGMAIVSAAETGGTVVFSNQYSELASSDGTAAGTVFLAPEVGFGDPLLALDGYVYFGANEPSRTDGATVEPLADIRPGPESSTPYPIAAVGENVLFGADDGSRGHELWAVPRAGGGASLVAEIRAGPEGGLPADPGAVVLGEAPGAAAGNRAVFRAGAAATGEELWVSDGTPGGTGLVRDVFPGPHSSEIRWLTAAGGLVFFTADDGVHGREPWVSDGSADGTRMLADLMPGTGSSLPAEFTAVGDRVYFGAHAPAHGRELWRSDGTPEGTQRVTDLAPGPLPSSPMALTLASGAWLWFVATDGVTGFEPYRQPVPGTIFEDGFEGGDLSAWPP